MPIRNVMLTVVLTAFCPNFPRNTSGRRRIFGLRSAGAGQNADSDKDYDANPDPHRWNTNEVGRDGQSYDQNDESDQVGTE
jgi:hypothetical protein